MPPSRRTATLLSLLFAWPALAGQPERIRLQSPEAVLEVTPALGGRVLHFAAPGAPNLLKVGAEVDARPYPEVSAHADDIGHLGHDVWLGPQSEWWTDQSVNTERRDTRAPWPPDPFLSFAVTRVLEQNADKLVLDGIDSPVSGVRLSKSFELDSKDPATVVLHVVARNIRDRPISRDLWFNTRASAAMRVYVPVAGAGDVRIESHERMAPPAWQIERGLFSLLSPPLPEDADTRRGKVFLQPSTGWMAGFFAGQALVIRFDHHPVERIHAEHGQVELYVEHGDDPAAGLLELEVHAPYRTLAAGETMVASERWSVLRYDGDDDPAAHAAFLCTVAAPRLRAPELCPATGDADAVAP